MKIKSLVLALTLLSFGSLAEASPLSKFKDFIKEHKRFEIAAATLITTSVVQWKGNDYCEEGQPERCNLGYGGHKSHGFNWFTIGIGGAMLGAAEGCWSQQPGWWFCYGLAYGVPAYQITVGTRDFLRYKPETLKIPSTTVNVDLSHIELIKSR